MLKVAILNRDGKNVAIIPENVTFVETALEGCKIHFADNHSVHVDDELDEAIRKLKCL